MLRWPLSILLSVVVTLAMGTGCLTFAVATDGEAGGLGFAGATAVELGAALGVAAGTSDSFCDFGQKGCDSFAGQALAWGALIVAADVVIAIVGSSAKSGDD